MKDAVTIQTLEEAKSQAEDVQAMFGGIKAVLSSTEDHVRYYIREAPLDLTAKTYLGFHAKDIQELLGVVEHLILEMEKQQDALVSFLTDKVFANRSERDGEGQKEGMA